MSGRVAVCAALLLAVLPGCSLVAGPRDGPPQAIGVPLPDQAFCERRAEDAPAVKELEMKGLGSPNFAASNQLQLRLAKQDAVTACLRSRGVIPPGGVERQKPI